MNTFLSIKNESLTKFIHYLTAGFFLVFPFYFLPITFDVVELNKSVLIVLFTTILLGVFVYKSFSAKNLTLNISYLTIPLLLFALALLISLVFSISIPFSLWGFYGSLSNSFPVLLSLAFLPLLIATLVNGKETLRTSLFYLIIGLGVSFVLSICAYFNVFAGLQNTPFGFLNNPLFSVAGPLGTLRFTAILASFLSTYFILRSGKPYIIGISALVLGLSGVACALYLPAIYFVLTVLSSGLAVFLFKNLFDKKKITYLISALSIGVAILFASYNSEMAESLKLNRGRIDLNSISASTSWSVTNQILSSRPLFGGGISTFIGAYSQFKPVSVNGTDFWDTRFIKPSSFYLLLLAELGLAGIGAFLFIVARFVLNSTSVLAKNKEATKTYSDLGALKVSVVLLLLSLIITPGNALVLGLLFGLIGLTLAAEKINNTGKAVDKSIGFTAGDTQISSLTVGANSNIPLYKVFGVVSVLLTAGSLYFIYVVFVSDIVFKSFFNTPTDLLQLRQNYANAANIHRNNDFYFRSIIEVNKEISRALLTVPQEEAESLSEDEKNARIADASNLLRQAALYASYITTDSDLGINPINWESRGLLWQFVIGADNQAPINAIQAYTMAAQREPANPRLIATIGTVYFQMQNYQQAAQYFEQAVILKPDYAAARYNLARALEMLEDYVNAYAVAETVMGLLPQDSPDRQIAQDYADSLKPKADEQLATSKEDTNLNINEEDPTAQSNLTEPNEPLAPNPQQTQTNTSDPSAGADVVTTEESEVAPTPSVTPSPTSDALPNQEPNTEPGSGFIEQNQGDE